jgi:integrase
VGAVFLSKIPVNMLIRNGKYHYRRRIPTALVDFFGRKEVTKALHTTRAQEATRLKNRLDGQLEGLFQACRFDSLTQEVAHARLHTILHGGTAPALQETQPTTIVVASPSRRRGNRLSDAVEAYSKECENRWTIKTKKEFAGIFNRTIEGLSDPWLQDLVRPTLVEYRDSLMRQGKHVKTVNKYLQILSSILRHANRLKWIQGNPAEGLGLQDNRREDEIRRAYSQEEIKTIFLALQRDKQDFYRKGKPERYWLPLLGIYTGARVNELAQLGLNDITEAEGIPAILITSAGDEGKRLKSESSRRIIPLHGDLLTLGFLVYVRNTRKLGHDRLFPALKLGPNGYQHYFNSQHFSGNDGWLRKQLPGLEPGMAFHCFRHAFATMLKNAEEPERLIEELMGHKNSSMSLGRYGKPYSLSIRNRAISQIKYELIPTPTESSGDIWDEEQNCMQVYDYLVCGETSIRIFLDDGEIPRELEQYLRPDLHGYSPFHGEINSFTADE